MSKKNRPKVQTILYKIGGKEYSFDLSEKSQKIDISQYYYGRGAYRERQLNFNTTGYIESWSPGAYMLSTFF